MFSKVAPSVLIDVIRAKGLTLEERPFTAQEAYGAREAFLTSASQIVNPAGSGKVVVRDLDRPTGPWMKGPLSTPCRARPRWRSAETAAPQSPGVARHELPWEPGPWVNNPNGVAARPARPRKGDTTPLGLEPLRAETQGSSLPRNPGLEDAIPLGL